MRNIHSSPKVLQDYVERLPVVSETNLYVPAVSYHDGYGGFRE